MISQSWIGQGIPQAWLAYTPTLANITLGNGTSVGAYIQIGKTVHFRWTFTYGSSGSAVGTAPTFTLPVAPTGMTANGGWMYGQAYDASGQGYPICAVYVSSSTMLLKCFNATFTYVLNDTITATVPFTWANGDIIQISGTYNVA